ncbi:MAG: exodeoxyribonuclease III [Candidatus Colwellbacteria bacterium]|nr:exodeoxyribonuclease III [Candidatus Colwellbacteria bacterium]
MSKPVEIVFEDDKPLYSLFEKTKVNIFQTAKIISWNVNGLQGILKKNKNGDKKSSSDKNVLQHLLDTEKPDIICLQEIRCSDKFKWEPEDRMKWYTYENYCQSKKGYSGTLISSKIKPVNVTYGMEGYDDAEGRVITMEFSNFFLLNVYSPNSGTYRLKYRTQVFEPSLHRHVANLNKPVVLVGDLNCTFEDIDKGVSKRIPGDSVEEQLCSAKLLSQCKLVDTFRYLHPTDRIYSWFYPWDNKNGCRFDYILVSKEWMNFVVSSDILYYSSSDHLPTQIFLDFKKDMRDKI